MSNIARPCLNKRRERLSDYSENKEMLFVTLKLQQQQKQPSFKPLPTPLLSFLTHAALEVCVCLSLCVFVLQVYVLASYMGSDGVFKWTMEVMMYEAEALMID